MRTIVCNKCGDRYNLRDSIIQADLHTFGGMGIESRCGLCGEENGGSDIEVPYKIIKRARRDAKIRYIFSFIWPFGKLFLKFT